MYGDLLEALLAFCFEDLVRLERYLEDIKSISSPYEQKVLELLEDKAKKCWVWLETVGNSLKKDLILNEQEYLQLLQIFFSFKTEVAKTISFFQYLPRPQVSPQVYVFLEGLLGSFYKDRFIVSLTGTLDDYTHCAFKEEDVFGAVLCLPCLEKSNPLMWAMLLREYASFWLESSGTDQEVLVDLGKIVEKESSLLKSRQDRIRMPTFLACPTEMVKWGKELFADLIALKIMGPGFFAACARVCQFKPLNSVNGVDNFLLLRLDIFNELLREKGLEDETIGYYWRIVKLAFQAQCSSLRSDPEPLAIEKGQRDLKKRAFSQNENDFALAKQVVREIILPVLLIRLETLHLKEFLPVNLEISNKLAGLLEQGLPVGAKKKVNQEDISRLLRSHDKEDVYSLLKMIEDEPAEYPEIIYAGWIHRKTWLEREFKLLFKNGSPEKTDLKKVVCFFDDLLLKSIQTAAVHKFFIQEM